MPTNRRLPPKFLSKIFLLAHELKICSEKKAIASIYPLYFRTIERRIVQGKATKYVSYI